MTLSFTGTYCHQSSALSAPTAPLQVVRPPNWDTGLPQSVLAHIAGGRDALKAMRSASKTWKAGFEASVHCLTVPIGAPGLPRDPILVSVRFPNLGCLDIGAVPMRPAPLSCLRGLPHLGWLRLGEPVQRSRSNMDYINLLSCEVWGRHVWGLQYYAVLRHERRSQ